MDIFAQSPANATAPAVAPPSPDQNQSVGQHDVSSQPPQPRLDQQGEHQAPSPTSGDEGQHEASAQHTEPTPQFDPQEYLRLKQENERYQQDLQENESLLNEIRRVAAEQKAQQAQQQLRSEIQQRVTTHMKKAGYDDEDIAAAIADEMYQQIDSTRTAYQDQMTTYQREVDDYAKNAIWSATRDGYADYVIKEYGLDPVIRPRLLQASNDAEMKMIADTLREAQSFYQRQAYSNTVQDQETTRRASGVDTITGTNSGPTIQEPMQPGSRKDLQHVLAGILAPRK